MYIYSINNELIDRAINDADQVVSESGEGGRETQEYSDAREH